MFADTPHGHHVEAHPAGRGTCPTCSAPVIAKTGTIIAHHWAHESRADCDPWSEPVGAWHLSWQELAAPVHREVVIGPHRADLRSPAGHVIELQHSNISPADIAAREAFYGPSMVWIFDARDAYDSGRLELRDKGDYSTFRWKHPRKSIAACRRRVLLDLGDRALFEVRRLHPEAPAGGWGVDVSKIDTRLWIASWPPGLHPLAEWRAS